MTTLGCNGFGPSFSEPGAAHNPSLPQTAQNWNRQRARRARLLWQVAGCAWGCFLSLGLLSSRSPGADRPITYVLDLREPQTHLVRVTMSVPQTLPATEIQFPAWNSLYQIRDFVRNVQELQAACDGRPRELIPIDIYTWKTGAESCSRLEVRYAVYANEEGVFSSVLNERHAFLNFALLLFYLPQERGRSAQVRFLLPGNWKLATLLEEGESPGEFQAPDYDSLADSPAEAGSFREYSYAQGGATYRVVVDADPADYRPERLLESLRRITAAETTLMQDVPFSRYTFILHFPREEGGGGMEHANGTAISVPAVDLRRDWGRLEGLVAHEFFHLWNVKRIRPQSLEPVDYVRGNDTRDLWFCEGVTSTYGELALLRAGLLSRQTFYQRLAQEIHRLQERPARHFQSVEQSGREAWLEKYPDYFRPQRSISYYNKGALLGHVLDLVIRQASRNQYSLDDVMRRLNADFARRGRFFTPLDLRALLAEFLPPGKGLDEFFRDYVSGTRELDYATFLGYAGLRLVTETTERAAYGFHAVQNFDGTIQVESVEEGSSAQRVGLQPGDVLLKMNGQTLTGPPEDSPFILARGQKVEFQIRRGNQVRKVKLPVRKMPGTGHRLEEIAGASSEQLRVREGWLAGKTTEPAARDR